MPELWDAYDIHDNIIPGVTLVRGEPTPKGMFYRIVNVLVQHMDGTYLLMQRSPVKHLALLWEATAGGACQKGESPLESVQRELKEETGISCNTFTYLGKTISFEHPCISYEYSCVVDCPKDSVTLQEGETVAYQWVTLEELLAMDNDKIASLRGFHFIDELKPKVEVDVFEMTTELAHKVFQDLKSDISLYANQIDFKEYIYDKEEIDSYVEVQKKKGKKLLAITYRDEPIGEIRFKHFEGASCEIGIILKNDSYKNKGIGTKAIERACFYAKAHLRLKSLTAYILKTNVRSQKAFLNNSFICVGEEDEFFIYEKVL